MSWNDGLTGTALLIAATTQSPLRVMAGPGTGKSFAMKRRVARLLEEGIEPRRILAVTFTRNAASSLVKDLKSLGVPGCRDINAVTLHAYCFGLLGKQEVFDFLGRVARPLLTFKDSGVLQFEGKMLLEDLTLTSEFGAKRDCTKRILAFEAAWARLQTEQSGWASDPLDQAFQQDLLEWLSFHNSMLLGELVPEALRYLRDNPACEARSAFDHVIVDEYQDLNRAEQDLIDLLSSNGALAIVGDIDQSIYRFRHANPEGIEAFVFTHGLTHDETLDQCRRCPTHVVTIADSLIRRNHPPSSTPRLLPKPDNPSGRIHRLQWHNTSEESQGLSAYVERLVHGPANVAAGDILILTPRRLFGYAIRDQIEATGVPVHSFYNEEALEKVEAQRAFTLLRLLSDREDRVALRWWLGQGSNNANRVPYRLVRQHCESTGLSPREVMSALADGSLTIPRTQNLVARFQELQTTVATLQDQELDALVNSILPADSDDCAVLREIAILAVSKCKNVEDLFKAVQSSITQPEVPEEAEFVRVMSLHKSKGLTSKVVIVAGCIQGIIPQQNLDQPPDEQRLILEEQRRLFYVAVTRGTEVLVLSSVLTLDRNIAYQIGARVQGGGGQVASAITSQFFSELGPQAPAAELGRAWQERGFDL